MFSKIRQLLGQLSLLFLLCLYHGVKKTKKKKGLPLLPSHSAGKERQGNVRQQPLPSPLHRQEIKPALQGPPKGFDPSPVPFPYLSHFFLWQKWASHSPHSWDRKKINSVYASERLWVRSTELSRLREQTSKQPPTLQAKEPLFPYQPRHINERPLLFLYSSTSITCPSPDCTLWSRGHYDW